MGALILAAVLVPMSEVAALTCPKMPVVLTPERLPYRACVDAAAKKHALPPRLLHAIVHVENGRWNPWAISVNQKGHGSERAVTSYEEAVRVVTTLWLENVNFDVGLGQVNTINMERYRVHPINLLDPCTNLDYAARILRESIDRHGYGWLAIERYNGRNACYPWRVYHVLKELAQ